MTVIGFSHGALNMICDAIEMQSTLNELRIYNNLKLPGSFYYNSMQVKETELVEDTYILGAVMPETKRKLVKLFKFDYLTLINESASITNSCKIGDGTLIDALVSLAANCTIGKYVTLYSNSSIQHDSIIGNYVTVCPNVAVCGSVKIGEGSFIGAGSVIKNGINIGNNCVIGCGSVVIRDVEDGQTVFGNPAHKAKISNGL